MGHSHSNPFLMDKYYRDRSRFEKTIHKKADQLTLYFHGVDSKKKRQFINSIVHSSDPKLLEPDPEPRFNLYYSGETSFQSINQERGENVQIFYRIISHEYPLISFPTNDTDIYFFIFENTDQQSKDYIKEKLNIAIPQFNASNFPLNHVILIDLCPEEDPEMVKLATSYNIPYMCCPPSDNENDDNNDNNDNNPNNNNDNNGIQDKILDIYRSIDIIETVHYV